MKIRTDFVTNSSSSNYVAINIKSPKLTEIMCSDVCKRTGDLDYDDFDMGCDRLVIDESEQTIELRYYMETYPHWYWEEVTDTDLSDHFLDIIGCPLVNLSSLPESLIKLMKKISESYQYYPFRNYDYAKLCGELERNREEILADTQSVDWTYELEGRGESILDTWFHYFSRHIAQKENLDYRPSAATYRSSLHYDKENGESFEEKYFYNRPCQGAFTEEDLDLEMELLEEELDLETELSEEDLALEPDLWADDLDLETELSEEDLALKPELWAYDSDLETKLSEDDFDVP